MSVLDFLFVFYSIFAYLWRNSSYSGFSLCWKFPFGSNFIGFRGFCPLLKWRHQRDPKKHFLHGKTFFEPSSTFVRLCSGCGRAYSNAKITLKSTQNVIFRVCVGRSRATDCYDFWQSPRYRHVINRSKLCIERFRSFELRKRQSLGPHRKPQWPLPVPSTNVHKRDAQANQAFHSSGIGILVRGWWKVAEYAKYSIAVD